MTQDRDKELRERLAALLRAEGAHVSLEQAVEGWPVELRGVPPMGLPYSAWDLVEHLRLTQRDILDYSRDPDYAYPSWPDDYWPDGVEPPDDAAWDRSVAAFHEDREAMVALVSDPAADLYEPIPWGASDHNLLRQAMLAADHTAYHTGQLIVVRRLLGAWS